MLDKTLAHLESLAAAARPIDDAEWGSERQIEAQNAFFIACEDVFPADFADDSEFSAWVMKATTDEMIDCALGIVRDRVAGREPKPFGTMWRYVIQSPPTGA